MVSGAQIPTPLCKSWSQSEGLDSASPVLYNAPFGHRPHSCLYNTGICLWPHLGPLLLVRCQYSLASLSRMEIFLKLSGTVTTPTELPPAHFSQVPSADCEGSSHCVPKGSMEPAKCSPAPELVALPLSKTFFIKMCQAQVRFSLHIEADMNLTAHLAGTL